MNIATTFCSTGTAAYFLHPAKRSGDLRLSAKTIHVAHLQFRQDTRTARTGGVDARPRAGDAVYRYHRQPRQPVSSRSDDLPADRCAERSLPLGLTPTTSTTVMTVIGDLLVVGTMKRINFSYPDYAKRHHGGYLGSKSREQCKTGNK